MADESWVEVYDEPRHRRRFANAFARVYDVLVEPGARTLYHRHTQDTFYVSVRPAKIRDQTWGEAEIHTAEVPAGICICRPHRDQPLIHQVGNVGDGDMRMIGAEIHARPPASADAPLEAAFHELQWERERLRAYRLELPAGEASGPITYAFSGLTVALSQGNLALRDAGGASRTLALAPGDVIWHDAPLSFELINLGEQPFRSYVAEWR